LKRLFIVLQTKKSFVPQIREAVIVVEQFYGSIVATKPSAKGRYCRAGRTFMKLTLHFEFAELKLSTSTLLRQSGFCIVRLAGWATPTFG